MRLLLIADAFPPLRSSGAVQLRDLARELVRQGHEVTVLTPDADIRSGWELRELDGVGVLRVRCPRMKDVGYVRRAAAEALMPCAMLWNLSRSPLARQKWDGIVWYSPSIFLGIAAGVLKRASRCRGYLILRDIFPEWALEMGVLRKGPAYFLLRHVAAHQYSIADVIGIQTIGNAPYVECWHRPPQNRVEVLRNWLAPAPAADCSISVEESPLADRRILVYAGNMGVAQGMDILLDLAERLRARSDIGLLFVGRGTAVSQLKADAASRGLDNVLFFDEIDPAEIPSLYAQCHIGLVALDPRHRTHNIPGKFLSYMQAGLPVLAVVNEGNDLISLIHNARVGRAVENSSPDMLAREALALIEELKTDSGIRRRCRELSAELFSAESAAAQIVDGLVAKTT